METKDIRGPVTRDGKKFTPQKLLGTRHSLGAGHAACAGCPGPSVIQAALHAARDGLGCEPVVAFATGCMEVVTTLYPSNAWRVPYMHSAFPNSAATASGIEAAIKARKARGEIPADKDIKVVAFGGDGGTYDIGLQALSGAMERGHDITYICYNNEAYMNTGVQRSSATPLGAFTNTAQVGEARVGKSEFVKDLTRIMIAHDLPYVAQASVHRFPDMLSKLQKAIAVRGPSFVNVLSTCPVGWGMTTDEVLTAAELAVECNVWPLYEFENGKYRITYRPANPRPLMDYIKSQTRFRHLLKPEYADIVRRFEEYIALRWQELNDLEKLGQPAAA
ncbi:MAG TPA: thiamine pyrophosphate-dependent enzyme [Phycisphaerae bacterium]|jgi:pyruvate ferredoxin oxidoreductase beta subunit|nr:thiamine pyrophosphate-dependent enzyme [Phycisphaerae bacterium]HOL25309.1 thiamine pyrophosphate-dependent enzyme [Phycisphaerae bacterium]HQA42940.1 thiamine pyrophosphate-dependent enzyme [Phycisphaerae bacterium]HXK85624.1 thiamine pyrophosphate-dependent enzyme [Phycisphaerae bacterium]